MPPVLSILICTLTSRKTSLDRLLGALRPQCEGDSVEILTEEDEGVLSIGAKRQRLLERATGDFVAYVDDDDMVSRDYVDEITWALQCCPRATHCSLRGILLQRAHRNRIFEHSNKYTTWETQGGIFVRPPNHCNAIRRDLALQAGFDSISWGEDRNYSEKLMDLGVLDHEAWIEAFLYHYIYTPKPNRD
jgi:glycosyltransferase involved in cell wall biosynthesis